MPSGSRQRDCEILCKEIKNNFACLAKTFMHSESNIVSYRFSRYIAYVLFVVIQKPQLVKTLKTSWQASCTPFIIPFMGHFMARGYKERTAHKFICCK